MKSHWNNRRGLVKYGIAYLLGVPITLLVIIFIISRGCAWAIVPSLSENHRSRIAKIIALASRSDANCHELV